ncbi:hypothetical protein KSC_057820 [Ktedonobacter sp. SOSP1-52]|uniref:WD40 repeat domain-containing serine/threonine protein kinase n=1 Tax=Ktedonobacter sp. SOSP1-52 TaxID=2778366 RepID=UPI001916AA21|nr:serine/threonine-protein kinase [Ktedonobacter sp. SOSP1-52]GHO66890.1 hypothetical protein KSC_057820 [Ktedonobacter sp. SOSP1-52]
MVDYSGRTIDNYHLLRQLGKGSFGEVYLAEHIHHKKLFAVKILRARLNKDNLRSFLNEARAFRLDHPHIMRIRDFGLDEDLPFIVMDYISGGTLRQLHPPGIPLPLKTIVSYVNQVGAALQFAHDDGLVHRDVKPENMLIDSRGKILLSDFGIVTSSHSWNPSHTSGVAGTPVYMAPEQIQARPVRASDQYALATIVYEWLVGVPPFLGTMAELAVKHLTVFPPGLREQDPTIPLEVEQVVMKALAKDPGQRFASVGEFAEALEKASKPPLGTTLLVLDTHIDLITSLAWSPNGLYLASSNGKTVALWDPETSQLLATYTGHRRDVTAVAWSPDGTCLASASSDRTVQIWEAMTRKPVRMYQEHTDDVFAVAWSPDGTYLASAGSDRSVRVWEPTTGKTLSTYDGHIDDILAVAWSPKGKLLASASYDTTVHVHDILSGRQVLTYGGRAGIYALAWSPDGALLASASYDQTVQVREVPSGRLVQEYQGHTAGIFALVWSPNGSFIASGDDEKTIHIWEASTGKLVHIYRGHMRGVRSLAWSPDVSPINARIASGGLDRVILIWQAS